jgi:hypothetical protein
MAASISWLRSPVEASGTRMVEKYHYLSFTEIGNHVVLSFNKVSTLKLSGLCYFSLSGVSFIQSLCS